MRRRIAIIGAGITGLAAAFHILDQYEDGDSTPELTIFEASERAGGCIQSLKRDGYTLELGADSLLAQKPAARELLERLDLLQQLIPMRPEYRGARLLNRGRLRPIPRDFRLFTPTSVSALLRSGIFSAKGIARAALEPCIPARPAPDETLASFVCRRFGREVLDRLAQPLVGGIYSADPRRLSMQATLPQFLEMERTHGSVLRAMMSSRSAAAAPQLMSLGEGLQCLVDALVRHVGFAVRVSMQLVQAEAAPHGWNLFFADGSRAQADALICTQPAYAVGQALRNVDASLAALLESIRYNSIATVNLAYAAARVPRLPAIPGFVVPAIEGRRITAATISSQKYAGRSRPDGVLIRTFIGGALQPELLELDDACLVDIARTELRGLLGISADPEFTAMRRWNGVLPEYGLNHRELIASIRQRAHSIPGLALAGSAFDGVGIPDCIASGVAAARGALAGGIPA